jgi:hypothetical protein
MATSVADLTEVEVYELVYQLKQCNESDPAETRRLLQDHPELARAVAQAQLRLGMIKERTASAPAPANAIVRASSACSVAAKGSYLLVTWLLGRVERLDGEVGSRAAGAAGAGAELGARDHPVAAARGATADHGAARSHGSPAAISDVVAADFNLTCQRVQRNCN